MKLEPDVAALALSCGVHPLAIEEEYIGGLQRFAASCAARAQQAEPVQEPVGAVLVNRESREGVMFYSAEMVPDPTTLKDRFELVKVYTTPPKREPVAESCTWQQDGDSESSLYATSCKRYFMLEDGTPEDNRLAWCCYCGKRLVQELITEEDEA